MMLLLFVWIITILLPIHLQRWGRSLQQPIPLWRGAPRQESRRFTWCIGETEALNFSRAYMLIVEWQIITLIVRNFDPKGRTICSCADQYYSFLFAVFLFGNHEKCWAVSAFFLDSAVSAWCSSNAVIDAVRCRSEKWAAILNGPSRRWKQINHQRKKPTIAQRESERERERENKSQERHQS